MKQLDFWQGKGWINTAAHFVSPLEGMERSEGVIETPPARLQPRSETGSH